MANEHLKRGRHEAPRYRINQRAVGRHEHHVDQARQLVELLHSTERCVCLGLMSTPEQKRRVLEALPPLPPVPR